VEESGKSSAQEYLERTEGVSTVATTVEKTTSVSPSDDKGGNLIHYLGHRKEDHQCPEGWLMDVYGYCREEFLMERREWDWWWNIRDYIMANRDSGYGSSY